MLWSKNMDTHEIQQALKDIVGSLHREKNVYASNRLPMFVSKPAYIIVNMDPDTKPGSHWVAIHIDKNNIGEYFDSFGRKPTGYHFSFMNRNCKRWSYNHKILQNALTSVCGKYCLLYLYYKFKKYTMDYFVSMFDYDNTLLNDFMLKYMYDRIVNEF